MATRAEITSGLAEILEEVAGVNPDDVAEQKSFTDDLDVDSLSMVEVVVAAEEKFAPPSIFFVLTQASVFMSIRT